jgi:predicted CxxxxCH...CXXCH cytochrome family protein
MLETKSKIFITGLMDTLTEAVKHVKEAYQYHRSNIDCHSEAAQAEGSWRDILPPRNDIWRDGQNK